MKTISSLSLLIVLSACSTPTVATNTPRGKPSAPVEVTAELSPRFARVAVTFQADAEGVQVALSGVDGLVVEGAPVVLEGGRFARGETRSFNVAYAPGQGRSQLVVTVSGTFHGSPRARVAAFGLGSGPLPQAPGEVQTTDDGDRVRVMTP